MTDINLDDLREEYRAHDLDEERSFEAWAEETLTTELADYIDFKVQEREFEAMES